MGVQSDRSSENSVPMTPTQIEQLERFIARWEGAVHAMRILARRPYISPAQAALIRAEAEELLAKYIQPLRLAVRGEALAEISARVEELGDRFTNLGRQRPSSP